MTVYKTFSLHLLRLPLHLLVKMANCHFSHHLLVKVLFLASISSLSTLTFSRGSVVVGWYRFSWPLASSLTVPTWRTDVKLSMGSELSAGTGQADEGYVSVMLYFHKIQFHSRIPWCQFQSSYFPSYSSFIQIISTRLFIINPFEPGPQVFGPVDSSKMSQCVRLSRMLQLFQCVIYCTHLHLQISLYQQISNIRTWMRLK